MNFFLKKVRKFLKSYFHIFLLIIVVTYAYGYLFNLPLTAIVGDAQRYNGYQAYFVKYSLANFGQLGLWDPFLSSGMSWISHPGGALFSPGAWIVTLVTSDITRGSLLLFYIHALSASFAFYFLCRVLGLKKITGFLVALVAISNQYIFLFVANGWFEELFGLTLIPLTVGLLWLALSRKNYLYAVIGGIAMSLNFFSNSYYVFHYNAICVLFVGLAFFVRELFLKFGQKRKTWKNLLKNIYSNVIFWVIFIGISAIKLLPLLEFRNISARNNLPLSIIETPDGVMTFSFFESLFRNFIIPAGHTNQYTQWANGLAIFFIFLAFLYFLVRKSFTYVVFFGLLLIGVWGYFAYRIPLDLYAFFYNFLPGFNSNNYPYRFIIIINFAFLICVALGLDILIRQKNKFLVFSGLFLAIVLVGGAMLYANISYNALSYPQTINVKRELDRTEITVIKPSSLTEPPIIKGKVPKYLLTGLLKIVNEYKPEGRVYSTFSSADKNPLINSIILENEISVVHHSYEPIVPVYEYGIIPHGSTQDSLFVTQKRYKIFSVLNTRFTLQEKGYSEYEGCKNLELIKSKKASDVSETVTPKDGVCEYLENRISPLIIREDGGIYYNSDVLPKVTLIENPILLISDNRFNDYSGFIAKQIMFHPDFDLYKSTILSGGSPYIDDYSVETLRKFPIIILVEPKIKDKKNVDRKIKEYGKYGGKVITLSSTWKYYQSLHVRHTSFFTKLPAWSYSESNGEFLSDLFKSLKSGPIGMIDIKKNTPEDMVFKVKTINDNAALQFSDSFFPGWKAMIDGKATELYMADGLVKGVIVPKSGEHIVRFYYDPDSFKKGALISGITLIVIFFAFIYNLKKKRKTKQ